MGCPSCQSSSSTTAVTYNTTATPFTDCACGCIDPVCPTPQPCTEITDSKCIIYTDAEIKCSTETIVPVNTSISTALNNIVSYFCQKQGIVTSADIYCGDFTIVPANTSIQDALTLVVEFICNMQLTPGPEGPQGIQGEPGTNGTAAYKFVHEQLSGFDGDTITITRTQLESCGLLPSACFSNDALVDETCDLHISVYYEFGGYWKKIPMKPYGILTTEGYEVGINATTGDLSINLVIGLIDPQVRVRIVILA